MSDEEQANQTSYPLPGEERAEHLRRHTLLPPAVANVIAGATHLNRSFILDATKPAHYNDTPIATFDVVQAWGLDFFLGNVVKYIQRHTKKGKPLEDLKKARTYLDEKIAQLEAQA